jgi:hypothetical protein
VCEKWKRIEKGGPARPLKRLLEEIGKINEREIERSEEDPNYKPTIRIAIITSRNAPADRRVVTTLRAWIIQWQGERLPDLVVPAVWENRVTISIVRPEQLSKYRYLH